MQFKKILEEAREGYYFWQRGLHGHDGAIYQVNSVFKYLFFLYYLALVIVLISFAYFFNGGALIHFGKKNFFLHLSVGSLLLYCYKLLADWLMKDILLKEISAEQEKSEQKRKKALFFYLFIASFISFGLSLVIADILT